MFRRLSALLFPLLAACASAPPAASTPTPALKKIDIAEKEMCEKVSCVSDARIVLKKQDGSTFDKTYGALPVVQPSGVAVYAGQKVQFEADIKGDHLSNFRQVTSVEHPEKTVLATLTQSNDGSMILLIQNPFKNNLKISMGIMPLDRNDLLNTTSCPVLAGKSGFELWPYPIFQVWLGDMRLLDLSDSITCSE